MWARIKRSVAIWLCPQLGKDSDYYWRMKLAINDNRHWLAYEFPIVAETMSWILEEDYNYSRSSNQIVSCEYPGGISQFRDYLRRKYKA